MKWSAIKKELVSLISNKDLNVTVDVVTRADRYLFSKSNRSNSLDDIDSSLEFETRVFLGRDVNNIDILLKEVHILDRSLLDDYNDKVVPGALILDDLFFRLKHGRLPIVLTVKTLKATTVYRNGDIYTGEYKIKPTSKFNCRIKDKSTVEILCEEFN